MNSFLNFSKLIAFVFIGHGALIFLTHNQGIISCLVAGYICCCVCDGISNIWPNNATRLSESPDVINEDYDDDDDLEEEDDDSENAKNDPTASTETNTQSQNNETGNRFTSISEKL